MSFTRSLKPLKGKWQFACSLMQTQIYDTPVMLASKFVIRTYILPSKSPKDLFLASLLFSIFYYSASIVFFVLKFLNLKLNFTSSLLTSRLFISTFFLVYQSVNTLSIFICSKVTRKF